MCIEFSENNQKHYQDLPHGLLFSTVRRFLAIYMYFYKNIRPLSCISQYTVFFPICVHVNAFIHTSVCACMYTHVLYF